MTLNFVIFYFFLCLIDANAKRRQNSDEPAETEFKLPVDMSQYEESHLAALIFSIHQRYDRRVTPTRNISAPVTVRISLKPYQLLGVNEVDQSISLNVWMTESWHDDYLYWDPTTYGNITEIRLPVDTVWRPDTYLYNNLEMDAQAVQRLINVIVETLPASQTTKVTMMYPAIFHTSCWFTIEDFPFDKQVCHLIFASWTYDIKTLDYYPADGNLVPLIYFIQNQEWDVLRFNVTRVEVKYACCPHPYVNLEYTIVIQRKPRFYILNVVIPFLIVAFTNFFGFFTLSSSNGERSEKITLGITTLLAMAVILLQVAEQVPRTSLSTPVIARLIIALIVLVGLAAVLTSIIMHWQHVSQKKTKADAVLRNLLNCSWWIAGNVGSKWKKQQKRNRCNRRMAKQSEDANNSTLFNSHNLPIGNLIPLEETLSLLQKSSSALVASLNEADRAASSKALSAFEANPAAVEKSQNLRNLIKSLTTETIALESAIRMIKSNFPECHTATPGESEPNQVDEDSYRRTSATISDYFVAAIALERFCLVAFCSITCALAAIFFLYGYSVQELTP